MHFEKNESVHDVLCLDCFILIHSLRFLKPTSGVLFWIFVLRHSYVTWKWFDPFGLCFYSLLGGSGAVLSLGLIIPISWGKTYLSIISSVPWKMGLAGGNILFPPLCECWTPFTLITWDGSFYGLFPLTYLRVQYSDEYFWRHTVGLWDSLPVQVLISVFSSMNAHHLGFPRISKSLLGYISLPPPYAITWTLKAATWSFCTVHLVYFHLWYLILWINLTGSQDAQIANEPLILCAWEIISTRG